MSIRNSRGCEAATNRITALPRSSATTTRRSQTHGKRTKLTAERIAQESSKNGGGKLSFPIKSVPITLAGQVAAKTVQEKAETAGRDGMPRFDLLPPTEHFALAMG